MIVNNVHPEYRKPQVARGVEVAGAARNRTAEVRGSNPLGSTSDLNKRDRFEVLHQIVLERIDRSVRHVGTPWWTS